jgi:copper(I)-binding protein
MHVTSEQDGMMQMRPLTQLQLQPGQPARFEPGGMHIMLNGVHQVLPVGTVFPLTLRFATAGDVQVTVKVVAPGAAP